MLQPKKTSSVPPTSVVAKTKPVRKARQIVSQLAVFVPAAGLCVHRTKAKAKKAGFDSIEKWVASLANEKPSLRSRFTQALKAYARRIVTKELGVGVAPMGCGRDLIGDAESAAGYVLGTRFARFPHLAARILERFMDGSLPRSTTLVLRHAARDAVRGRIKRPALRYTRFLAAA